MDNDERRKMKQLINEKGKGDEPLQWMYKQSKPDTEDFLLGKRLDKFEEDEEKKEDSYGALFNERIQHNIQMDAQSKMREDPLFAIRHREEEAKRRLLDNPVKMKRLQQAIERQNKEKKKKKKHAVNDSDSDDDLMSAYLNIVNAKRKGGNSSDRSEHRKPRDVYKEERRGGHDRLIEDREYTRDNGRGKGKYVDRDKHDSNFDRRKYMASNDDDDDDNRHHYSRKEERDYKYRDIKIDRSDSGSRYREDRSNRGKGMTNPRDTDRNVYNNRYNNDRYSGSERKEYRYSQSEIPRSKRDHNDDNDRDSRSRYNERPSHRKRAVSPDLDKERKDKRGDRFIEHHKRENTSRKDKYYSSGSDNESNNGNRKTTVERKSTRHNSSSSNSEGDTIVSKGRKKSEKMKNKKRHDSSPSPSSSSSSVKNSEGSQPSNVRGRRQVSSKVQVKHSDSSSSDDSQEDSVRRNITTSGSDSEQEKKPKHKNYGLVILNPDNVTMQKLKKVSKDKKRSKSSSESPPRRKRSRSRTPPRQPKRKLTEEDKKKRLAEMMDNAKWREDQRSSNVRHYAKEEQLEQDNQSKNYQTTGSSEFVNPMMSLHAESSSVADRIKRNKHNILRTTADMDRGFSKK